MSGFICTRCGWHGTKPAQVSICRTDAIARTTLDVCPKCAELESTLCVACDTPGCKLIACMGFPTADGLYFHACTKHGPGRV